MEFLSTLGSWLTYKTSDEQDKVATEDKVALTELIKQEEAKRRCQMRLKAHNFAWQLYHLEFRRPEIIKQLSEDLELAKTTLEMYVKQFKFKSMSSDEALRSFLRLFWPGDEPEFQDLLVTHFSRWFLTCNSYPLTWEHEIYILTCAMIILNADLNGRGKGRKMTCKEFRTNLNNTCGDNEYNQKHLKSVYKSIKTRPLKAFIIKTRYETVVKNEVLISEDSSCKSPPGTDNNPTTTVHKTGNLICKIILDKSGRKTRQGWRAWKPFTAVLKGMDLYLQKDTPDLCEKNSKNVIRLHHAMAYPIDYKNRPHVLCLRTADSSLFYFQAESEVEQTSWVQHINFIAARYSAPPLTSASSIINTHQPLVLPSYPTTLSLEQQLENHKDRLQRLSGHKDYYQKLPVCCGVSALDYVDQDLKRHTTYVRVLEELEVEYDAGEGCSN